MASEDKNHTVFSVSEEEVPAEQVRGQIQRQPVQPVREEVPAPQIKKSEEQTKPVEEIKHGYDIQPPQPEPKPEPAPVEEEKPEGLLARLFPFFGSKKGEEKKEEVVTRGMHIADLVEPDGKGEPEESPGIKFSTISNALFFIIVTGSLIYGLVVLGPAELFNRIVTVPQWFPGALENWFESNVYPFLESLVGKFEAL